MGIAYKLQFQANAPSGTWADIASGAAIQPYDWGYSSRGLILFAEEALRRNDMPAGYMEMMTRTLRWLSFATSTVRMSGTPAPRTICSSRRFCAASR